eukprot:TRINITY_DN3708_c0_g1_i4.p1 TRINITY_DN3708_c0_g1~~TRINITY_DN3708_c0_g1_i4.p1  ORF type:complete len:951 (+),score=168.25 TRINITY_DN3708_c0_g1_i4:43-2895(+)
MSIRKSEQDNRLYRHFTLPNALDVLLISDPTTDKSAASMDVKVGFFNDPEEVPGLAHFCEHMVFLGTKKYPDEASYLNFLSEHGGNHNAFTSTEETNYYFDITPQFLEETLDRFAQFFIHPLFTQDSTEREMNAVDSEHAKNIQNDGWRSEQFLRSTSSVDHPYHKFGTGSKATLTREDIREQLLSFHSKYYSSNLMKLAVLGQESLDQLERWVKEKFSDIPNKSVTLPGFNGRPLSEPNLKRKYSVVSIKDLRTLSLIWPFGEQHTLYTKKPLNYFAHLIGHEGPGSVLSYLKKKGLANSLLAGSSVETSDFSFFKVSLDLTEEGINFIEDIITSIYQYIKLIKKDGIQQWIFQEMKQLAEIGFRFKDKEKPISYVSSISSWMQQYPISNVLSAPYLIDEYDPELISQHLNLLSPNNMRVHVFSKSFEGKTSKTEKWYNVAYSEDAISTELLQKWQDPPLNPELVLPNHNPFIPDDFSLKEPHAEYTSSYPILIKNSELSRIWYKHDQTFKKPKANLCFDIVTPVTYQSPKNCVAATLFSRLLADSLTEFSYDADLGGLHYSLSATIEGLQLHVTGYNCKQRVLLQKVIQRMAKFKVNTERFQLIKEAVTREYKNFQLEQPYSRALYNINLCTESFRWTNEEYIEAIEDIDPTFLQDFIPRLLESLFIEGLIHGNISHKEALDIFDTIEGVLKPKPLIITFQEQRVIKLTKGKTHLCRMYGLDPENNNSAIENFYQIGISTIQLTATLDLLCQIIQAPAYSQLRTTEQLGYLVFTGTRSDRGTEGFRVIIQSSVKDAGFLDERIEAFLKTFRADLEKMPNDEWERNVASVIDRKLEKDKSLREETKRYWREIINPHLYQFDRAIKEVEVIKKLKKQDMLEFYDKYISPDSKERRKLSSQVFGKGFSMVPNEEAKKNPDVVVIEDKRAFKRSMPLFPLVYTGLDRKSSRL